MTTGVAIPPFRPLSTVIRRRTRDGTASLVTTGTPRAASVGASAAPTNNASHTPSVGSSHMASPQPARTVRGRPMASSRRTPPRSRRRSWTRTRAASENSTHTSVISTSGLSASGAEEGWTQPHPASAAPTPVKTMGAVRSARSSRAETTPGEDRRSDDDERRLLHERPLRHGGLHRPQPGRHRGTLGGRPPSPTLGGQPGGAFIRAG
jgi:hypothetical protein